MRSQSLLINKVILHAFLFLRYNVFHCNISEIAFLHACSECLEDI